MQQSHLSAGSSSAIVCSLRPKRRSVVHRNLVCSLAPTKCSSTALVFRREFSGLAVSSVVVLLRSLFRLVNFGCLCAPVRRVAQSCVLVVLCRVVEFNNRELHWPPPRLDCTTEAATGTNQTTTTAQ